MKLIQKSVILGVIALMSTRVSVPALGSALRASPAAADTGGVKGKFVSLERVKTKGDTSERDVVVYLKEKTPGAHKPPAEPVVIKQERLIFKPHVLAVVAGTPLRFENVDAVVHNVFSADACCKVNLDMPATGKETLVLSETGVASIICRLHPDMAMFIVVLANPFFRTIELTKQGGKDSDAGAQYTGEFEISGVPPGEYVLTYWNKKLKAQEFPVTITAGSTATLDVTVPVAAGS